MSDPLWSYVKFASHFEAANGSVRIVNERHVPAVISSGVPTISTLQSKFGSSSLRTTSVDDMITLTGGAQHALGTDGLADFCMEVWLRPEPSPATHPIAWSFGYPLTAASFGMGLAVDSTINPGKYTFLAERFSTSAGLLVSTSNVVYGEWAHIAVTRNSGTWCLFVNGALEATAVGVHPVAKSTVTDSLVLRMCNSAGADTYYYLGFIDEARFTAGASRYSAAFTAPTAAFEHGDPVYDNDYDKVLFHCHFNGENGATTFVDQKGNAIVNESNNTLSSLTTVHPGGTALPMFGGSVLKSLLASYYPRLKVVNAAFSMGASDFTFEGYSYLISQTGADQPVFRLVAPNGTSIALEFGYNYGSNANYLYVNGVRTVGVGGAVFGHFAIVRTDTTIKVYLQGVVRLTVTIGAGVVDSNGTLYMVGAPDSVNGFYGYIEEVRVTKGLARYTGNFTPPVEPFPDFAVQKLTGTVRDPSGNPISRKVRSYRTSDGLLIDSGISDPTTGAFQLRATDVSKHFVVVHDDTKNALVYDHITPVV